ncbi:hypothetical protein ANN_01487 [Periplaneta americana]|uniref:Endonuclease/exonuclease/phosphatase domain-containing protein n=1 Tax=Periplaneta americana TaxID=6978 RepID=A0ABQ8TWQ0_PERAM|nr:hypothetical protein ANN_01487 [Periplaneta americana]
MMKISTHYILCCDNHILTNKVTTDTQAVLVPFLILRGSIRLILTLAFSVFNKWRLAHYGSEPFIYSIAKLERSESQEKDDHIKDSFYEELEHTFDQFPRYHMKILLGDFNAKVGREDIFRPTIGKESLHAISSDNGVRLVNFATSKNLIVKSITFPYKDIHKYTWTSPDGLTHNQIDHILIDKRRHTSIVDIRTFRGADCNSDHYLVIGELRERLSVAKQVEQQVNITKFNNLKLKDEEAKQNYQVEISNRFATLESSDEVEKELDVNSVWENIRDSIKIAAEQSIGYYETKKKKPWFDEDCCMVVERRKQAKLKFLQDPVEEKRDNYFNERREASRTLRNKRELFSLSKNQSPYSHRCYIFTAISTMYVGLPRRKVSHLFRFLNLLDFVFNGLCSPTHSSIVSSSFYSYIISSLLLVSHYFSHTFAIILLFYSYIISSLLLVSHYFSHTFAIILLFYSYIISSLLLVSHYFSHTFAIILLFYSYIISSLLLVSHYFSHTFAIILLFYSYIISSLLLVSHYFSHTFAIILLFYSYIISSLLLVSHYFSHTFAIILLFYSYIIIHFTRHFSHTFAIILLFYSYIISRQFTSLILLFYSYIISSLLLVSHYFSHTFAIILLFYSYIISSLLLVSHYFSHTFAIILLFYSYIISSLLLVSHYFSHTFAIILLFYSYIISSLLLVSHYFSHTFAIILLFYSYIISSLLLVSHYFSHTFAIILLFYSYIISSLLLVSHYFSHTFAIILLFYSYNISSLLLVSHYFSHTFAIILLFYSYIISSLLLVSHYFSHTFAIISFFHSILNTSQRCIDIDIYFSANLTIRSYGGPLHFCFSIHRSFNIAYRFIHEERYFLCFNAQLRKSVNRARRSKELFVTVLYAPCSIQNTVD